MATPSKENDIGETKQKRLVGGAGGGSERIDFDWKTLNAILQFKATQPQCASILECSEDLIANRIKEKYNLTFSEYRHQKMAKVALSLWQKQFELAMQGNVTLLIWLGKQLCEQSDKQEITGPEGKDLTINYKLGE
jgi:hypothetical protein